MFQQANVTIYGGQFNVINTGSITDEGHEFRRRSSTPLPSDTAIQQQIPLKPEIFHGRDDVVEEIAQLLMKEETSRVCILGPGGMGKTSISLAAVESPLVKNRFPVGNRVWVPCVEATSATLLLEILFIQLQVPGDKQVTLQNILSELESSKQPRLILLDNFETPWNAPGRTRKEVGDILRTLATLSHIAILVTMRGSYPPCDNAIKWQSKVIQPTDEAACLRIYHDINPDSENDPDVTRLLATLGHMPFAVTLMANLGKEGQSTGKELLDAWDKFGPDILPDEFEQSMNRSISLSVDSDLVKRNPNALLLLQILSLLPAGTTKDNLRWWAPAFEISMIPSAIATLSHVALLVKNKQESSNALVLSVLPVVQSFMQQHSRVNQELQQQIQLSCCQYVLDHASRYFDLEFSAKSKALAVEDPNIQSILCSSSTTVQHTHSLDKTIEALIAFSWHRCDTKPRLDITNHAVIAAKASGIKKYIASAEWCLGRTYQQLSEYDCSYEHLQEAYTLFNDNSPPLNDLHLQLLGVQCGIDLVRTMHMVFPDKNKAVSLAQEVVEKCAALSDDHVHGQSLVCLGSALNAAQQRQEALDCLNCARTMLNAVESTSNLATAHQIIARIFYRNSKLKEALEAIQDAWILAELADNPFVQSVISLAFGRILLSLNRDSEAWTYIEIALMKASYVGNKLTIARALDSMGYGYLRRGDYQNAYGAYQAAAEKYIGTVEACNEKLCKDNMDRIQQKQSNPDADVGFYRSNMDIDKSLFYPSPEEKE